MSKRPIVVEAAVDRLEDAIAAQRVGVDRLELCGNLRIGGITPDRALLSATLARVSTPVFAMIRPRGGDFVYAPEEVDRMVEDIDLARTSGADGIVTGALTADGRIDDETMRLLMDAADGMPVTFHRAFDRIAATGAISDLIELGVKRILTSGGRSSALVGADVIASLVLAAGQDMTILAGGFVRARNVRELVRRTGVSEVHSRFVDEREMKNLVVAAQNA